MPVMIGKHLLLTGSWLVACCYYYFLYYSCFMLHMYELLLVLNNRPNNNKNSNKWFWSHKQIYKYLRLGIVINAIELITVIQYLDNYHNPFNPKTSNPWICWWDHSDGDHRIVVAVASMSLEDSALNRMRNYSLCSDGVAFHATGTFACCWLQTLRSSAATQFRPDSSFIRSPGRLLARPLRSFLWIAVSGTVCHATSHQLRLSLFSESASKQFSVLTLIHCLTLIYLCTV